MPGDSAAGERGSISTLRADLPREATRPAEAYIRTNIEIVEFIAFIAGLAERADEVRKIAQEALRTVGNSDEPDVPEDQVQRRLARFQRLMAEVTLTRAVDNYLSLCNGSSGSCLCRTARDPSIGGRNSG
jgi:hypothetical protein